MKTNEIFYAVKRFFKGKGFYLAFGCLLAAGAALAFAATGGDPEDLPEQVPSQTESTAPSYENVTDDSAGEVLKPESNVPADSSEAEASSEPDVPSEPEPASSEPPAPSEPDPVKDTAFYLPTQNAVTKGYSDKTLVFSPTLGEWRVHLGVDFGGKAGDRVLASSAGTVFDVYDDELYGATVVLDHGENRFTKYCGLRNIRVEKGDEVTAGDILGEMSGSVPVEDGEGVHVHVELIDGGEQKDLMEIVKLK
ncbi:MAG: peptidoglycan DD-metalloendopeptidase family protein [Clostridia bacterium]|nr:peptidoglycan DD-metalloendopeptidase family protein [Clostridia bacterium]